jgi:hypothetical protein
LDVFNGFLLSANLDALFDKFLISFSDAGEILIGSSVSLANRHLLGVPNGLKLRWVAAGHANYLPYHREQFQAENALSARNPNSCSVKVWLLAECLFDAVHSLARIQTPQTFRDFFHDTTSTQNLHHGPGAGCRRERGAGQRMARPHSLGAEHRFVGLHGRAAPGSAHRPRQR